MSVGTPATAVLTDSNVQVHELAALATINFHLWATTCRDINGLCLWAAHISSIFIIPFTLQNIYIHLHLQYLLHCISSTLKKIYHLSPARFMFLASLNSIIVFDFLLDVVWSYKGLIKIHIIYGLKWFNQTYFCHPEQYNHLPRWRRLLHRLDLVYFRLYIS